MELIGVVVVALLGACVGLLVGLYLQGSKRVQLSEQSAERHGSALVLVEHAAQQRAAAQALAEKQHAEVRGHLMTMTAALAERMQLVGAALAAELRQANAEHRNDLRLAVGLPRASAPGEEPPPTRPTRRSTRRASTGDDPTPPSGWTLEQVRAHTDTAEERRS